MSDLNPMLFVDSYKLHHKPMYPNGMVKLYSNGTPRASRMPGVKEVVVFTMQHTIREYLIEKFNKNFFMTEERERCLNQSWALEALKGKMVADYKRHCPVDTKHIEDLWDLGYLPIEIKALEEGTLCPIGVPVFTITNTHPSFAWLVNYLETLISCCIWQGMTSATITHEYKKILTKHALESDEENVEFVNWQAHDFSMRGMSSVESAITSGMGHLLSVTGSDNIPAIYQLEKSYSGSGLIGASIPATEHSVMCMGNKENEVDTFRRLLTLYPEGNLAIVSDTWDLWDVAEFYLPVLRDLIMSRNGKLVIRPDSGNPADILCGLDYEEIDHRDEVYLIDDPKVVYVRNEDAFFRVKKIEKSGTFDYVYSEVREAEVKGLVQLLWDAFAGTTNTQGYKVLDSHIGAIYGDSITLARAEEICTRLRENGFASTNVVLGIGSYTYQYNTRDTFGFAIKATYGEVMSSDGTCTCENTSSCECGKIDRREIYKDPITDDGTKKSKRGLLRVDMEDGKIVCYESQTPFEETQGLLQTVFKDGKLYNQTTLERIREKLKSQFHVEPAGSGR
jgi:nicotinamide phosphoribosyltransferase